MFIKVNPHSGVPVYRQVYDQFHRRIISGRIEPGSKLPSVRHLAVKLKVNPMTISKVYSYLERDGLVARQRGIGLFVRDLAGKRKKIDSQKMVSEQASRAVSAAIELGVSKDELIEIISKQYDKNSKGID